MIKDLFIRNAKRQAEKYFIYWGSLIATIALIYGFHALVFSDAVNELSNLFSLAGSSDLIIIFIIFSIIIIFILGWFVSYMMNFILRKRSKEISTYMILGMQKQKIFKLLFHEMILIGVSALFIGGIVGIFISEVLESLVIHMFDGEYDFSIAISLPAVGLTILYFCAIYLLALLKSRKIINKMKLIDLLHYDRKNELVQKKQKKLGMLFLSISIFCGIGSSYLFSMPNNKLSNIAYGILLMAICLLVLFVGMVSLVQKLYEKNIHWKYKKTHLFLYRLLFSKINKISVVFGVISMLFTFSMICIGMGRTFYTIMQKTIELQGFDIMMLKKEKSFDFSQYRDYLSENVNIESEHTYNLYTQYDTLFMSARNEVINDFIYKNNRDMVYSGIYEENRYDMFIRYSDYNKLREMLHLERIEMETNNFAIHCMPYLAKQYQEFTRNSNTLKVSNLELIFKGIYTEYFSQYDGYGNGQDYIIIIPDDLADKMDVVYCLYAAQTSQLVRQSFFDSIENKWSAIKRIPQNMSISMDDTLPSRLIYGNITYISAKYASSNAMELGFIILPLFYLALIICIIGTVILAVQLLSENSKTLKHYDLLKTLGMNQSIVLKTLRKHILLYFMFPFAPAVIFSLILVAAFTKAMLILGFSVPVFLSTRIPVFHAIIFTLAVFVFIYCIYVLITYLILKKGVLTKK